MEKGGYHKFELSVSNSFIKLLKPLFTTEWCKIQQNIFMLKSFLIISFTIIRLNQWVLSKQISINFKSSICIYTCTRYLKSNPLVGVLILNGHTNNNSISSLNNPVMKTCLSKRAQACFTIWKPKRHMISNDNLNNHLTINMSHFSQKP